MNDGQLLVSACSSKAAAIAVPSRLNRSHFIYPSIHAPAFDRNQRKHAGGSVCTESMLQDGHPKSCRTAVHTGADAVQNWHMGHK